MNVQDINEKGQTLPGGRRCPPEPENGKVSNPIYRNYNRIFGSFYGVPFEIDDDNITAVLRDILGLIEVAEYLGCVRNIARTVETAILSQGITLHRSISGNPSAWSALACRIRSELVFKESVVHLVGRWNELDHDARQDVVPDVRAVCERKHAELSAKKAQVEHQLLKHYPADLQKDAKEHPNTYNRQAYSNDIMGWVAISLFKHWLASAIVQDKHRHGADGGFWLYSVIGEGGHAYLAEGEIAAFHKRFPMSVKGSAVFLDRLMAIKESVKKIVDPLLLNYSQLEPKEFGLKYLTCVDVRKQDLPWYGETEPPLGPAAGHRSRQDEVEDEEEMEDHDAEY